jgi:C1A family cysteine protease
VFDADGNLPAGVGTWIVRNSWSTMWGDRGYITTKATDKKGNRCNSIATDALYFDLK